MVELTYFLIPISTLTAAEAIYPNAVSLIGPYLQSLYYDSEEVFYDEILQYEFPFINDPDFETYWTQRQLAIISYDIYCNICDAAVKLMQMDLLSVYQYPHFSKLLTQCYIASSKRIDNHTVELVLIPHHGVHY